jgi:plasmid stability protein
MASLTIKSVPDDLYEQLRQSATQHRRSINSEVIVCLQRALRSSQMQRPSWRGHVPTARELLSLC